MLHHVRTRGVVGVVVAVLSLSGCLTGQRPSLGEPPVGGSPGSVTGDLGVDLVLERLESTAGTVFTSEYRVLRKLGPVETTAVVAQDRLRRSVTLGSVRYLTEGTLQSTCDLVSRQCEEGVQEARSSDVGLSSTFFGDAAARMLRVSFSRRSGPAEASTRNVAGIDSICVSIPVGAGAETYCAVELGGLAYLDTAAHTVELTSSSPVPDEERFTPLG